MNVHMIEEFIRCRDNVEYFARYFSKDEDQNLVEILHNAIFNEFKVHMILMDTVSRCQLAVEDIHRMMSCLPSFFFKTISNNRSEIKFENNSVIIASRVDPNSVRGMACHMIYVRHGNTPDATVRDFWYSCAPIVASTRCKMLGDTYGFA